MDTNGDGQISKGEFAGGLHDLKVAASDGEVAALFRKFDPDGSGLISFRELHVRRILLDLDPSTPSACLIDLLLRPKPNHTPQIRLVSLSATLTRVFARPTAPV